MPIVWSIDTLIFAGVAIVAFLVLLVTFIVDEILDIFDVGLDDLNIQSVAAFFAGFGATGWLLSAYFGVSPLVAALSGLGGGLVLALIVVLAVRNLQKVAGSSSFSIQEIVGQDAIVTLRIPAKGVGQVQYRMGGAIHTATARSQSSQEIPRGQRVRILEVLGADALVSSVDE